MRGTAIRRLLVVAALGLTPWTVILGGAIVTLVTPLGLLDGATGRFVGVPTLLDRGGGLPRVSALLPASFLCYLGAVASAGLEVVDDRFDVPAGDPRVTGGLLALSALAHLGVSYAVLPRLRYTPLPVGVPVVLVVVWWFYWPALSTALPAVERG